MLDPPRQKVAMVAASPSRGPANAPVEMVEFSDFQCPFCQRAGPTVTQVFATYGDRIRFVYRHYPLPNHPVRAAGGRGGGSAPTSRGSSGRTTTGCSPTSSG